MFIMAANHQDYMVISHGDILASPLEMVRNKFVKFGEQFFIVPLDRIKFKRFPEPVNTADVFCCAMPYFEIQGDAWVCRDCGTVRSKNVK